jgi:hypothetical protein
VPPIAAAAAPNGDPGVPAGLVAAAVPAAAAAAVAGANAAAAAAAVAAANAAAAAAAAGLAIPDPVPAAAGGIKVIIYETVILMYVLLTKHAVATNARTRATQGAIEVARVEVDAAHAARMELNQNEPPMRAIERDTLALRRARIAPTQRDPAAPCGLLRYVLLPNKINLLPNKIDSTAVIFSSTL